MESTSGKNDNSLTDLRLTQQENAFKETIREIQDRYEYVINNISEIIFQTDKDGFFTFLNSVWDKVTGFTFEETIGTNIFGYINIDDRGGLRREFNEMLGHESGSLSFESRLKTKERGYIWTDIQIQLTYSAEGILLGTTGTISDIDSKKKNFSELQYRLMFERIIMDISTELMNFEPEELELKIGNSLRLLCEISGYDCIYIALLAKDYSIIEKSFLWDLNSGTAQNRGSQLFPESSSILKRLLNLETIFYNSVDELSLKQRNEIIKLCGKDSASVLIIPLVFNKVLTGIFGFASDQSLSRYENERISLLRTAGEIIISAIKRMEIQKALIESENNYSSVINNIKEVIFQLNSKGEWAFLNKAWTEFSGFGFRESLSVSFLIFVYPDDRQNNLKEFRSLISREKDSVRYESRMITRSGSFRWAEIYMRTDLGNNEVTGISGTIVDITERKHSEILQKTLYEIAILTSAIDDLDRFYSSLHNILCEMINARNFCFILYDRNSGHLSFPYFVNTNVDKVQARPLGEGLLDIILRTQNALLVNKENRHQVINDNKLEEWEKGFVDFLGIPLMKESEIIGAFAIYNYDENIRYTKKDLEIMITIAHHIKNALERKTFIEHLQGTKGIDKK